MTLFFFPLQALIQATEYSSTQMLLPSTLSSKLKELKENPSDITLQCECVATFFQLKRETYYYSYFARNLTSLHTFKKNIDNTIEEKTGFNLSQVLNPGSLFLQSFTQEELKICAEYYLLKAKIWNTKNKDCIETHDELHAVIKSMAILYHRKLLTQEHFDFITSGTMINKNKAEIEDITYLLAALEIMSWLNQKSLFEKVKNQYKFKLGEACLSCASAQIGLRENFVYLSDDAREILRRETEKNIHPIDIQSMLIYFSKKPRGVQVTKDHLYLHWEKNVSKKYKELVKCIENYPASPSDFFENQPCKNYFTIEHLDEMLSLSATNIHKLATELLLLKIDLGRFFFEKNFFLTLIHAIKNPEFSSKSELLDLLDKRNCLDAHIISAIYQAKQHSNKNTLSIINQLLANTKYYEHNRIIRFYFESNLNIDLSSDILNIAPLHISPRFFRVIIYPKSLEIIKAIQAYSPKMLTEKFLYTLQWMSFIDIMLWALKKKERLPWDTLDDIHFLNLNSLPHKKEVMRILDASQTAMNMDFFNFMTQQHPTKIIKEIDSVLPILMQENLANPSTLRALLLHLKKEPIRRGPSTITQIITQSSADKLHKIFHSCIDAVDPHVFSVDSYQAPFDEKSTTSSAPCEL
jgi:hypothetical protein